MNTVNKIYIPEWLLRALDDETRVRLLSVLSSGRSQSQVESPFSIVEDEVYNQCAQQVSTIYELNEKIYNSERELKHLRKLRDGVDAIKLFFK